MVRHAKEYGLRGHAFKKGFLKGEEQLEALRQRVFAPLIALEKEMGEQNLAALLLEYLQKVGVQEKLEKQADELDASGFSGRGTVCAPGL